MKGRTKSSSRALSVAQEAAEVSGRAYLPWWQKWDYNGVEIIRRGRECRKKKKREDEREEVVKKEKRWLWFICWRGRREKKRRRRREEGKEEEGD